jgi:hypothetical protein
MLFLIGQPFQSLSITIIQLHALSFLQKKNASNQRSFLPAYGPLALYFTVSDYETAAVSSFKIITAAFTSLS